VAGASKIQYWQCPQDPDHVWDFDDWRVIQEDGWRFKALCPRDRREMARKTAVIRQGEEA